MKIAYQGVKGAYSQIAIEALFENKRTETLGVDTFEKVFELVLKGKCQYGLIPLENSLTGSIHQNYDLLAKYNLSIVGETYLKISHHLLAVPYPKINNKKKRLKMIKKAYSHPQALLQCQKFFKNHPWVKAMPAEDTAGAALDLAKQKDLKIAAIASKKAAKIYGLEVLKEEIETNKNNFTRFVLIGRKKRIPRANKVSLIFSLPHKPGSLYKSLAPFAKRKINLTKIESRPLIGKPWEYLFYLDFETPLGKKVCLKAIEELKKGCPFFKILGFYQQGKKPRALPVELHQKGK